MIRSLGVLEMVKINGNDIESLGWTFYIHRFLVNLIQTSSLS